MFRQPTEADAKAMEAAAKQPTAAPDASKGTAAAPKAAVAPSQAHSAPVPIQVPEGVSATEVRFDAELNVMVNFVRMASLIRGKHDLGHLSQSQPFSR